MNIYIEIDKNHQEDIVVKNHKEILLKNRELFENHIIDFSSINKLKGDKDILSKSFLEELSHHITE
jgi:sporulation protein YlmC with PRC-barrel domain